MLATAMALSRQSAKAATPPTWKAVMPKLAEVGLVAKVDILTRKNIGEKATTPIESTNSRTPQALQHHLQYPQVQQQAHMVHHRLVRRYQVATLLGLCLHGPR